MPTPANAIGITDQGIVQFDGVSDFTALTTTQYAVLVGGASNTIGSVGPGAANTVLVGQGAGANPAFGTVPNAALANSTISLSNGTNISVSGSPVSLGGSATINVSGPPSATTLTQNGVVIGNGTSAISATAAGTTNQVLLGNTGSAPTFGSITNAMLPSSGQITLTNGANIAVTGSPVALGGSATVAVSGPITPTSYTANGILYGNGSSALQVTAAGTTNQVLLGNTGLAPSWGSVPNAALANSGVTLSNGTNISITGGSLSLGGSATVNVSGPITPTTYTTNGVLYGNSTSALQVTAAGTTNQVLTATTGSAPAWQSPGPLACAFSAYQATNASNVTGDGTLYTVGTTTAFTEYFDLGNNFNTNGTFTAPVNGYYFFSGTVFLNNVSSSMTSGTCFINHSGVRSFQSNSINAANARDVNNLLQLTCTCYTQMTAGDTCFFQVRLSNGTKTAAVVGSVANSPQTYFSGYLVQRS